MAEGLAARSHAVSVVTVDWRVDRSAPLDDGELRVTRIDPRSWYPQFSPVEPPFVVDREPRGVLPRRLRTAARMVRWGPYAPWARRGLAALLEAHRSAPVDVVWAIHGDASAHEIGYRFHRATGVPWVADFKDPWDLFASGPVARGVQLLATTRRLRTAAALTETADGQARSDRARFGRPTFTVPSGYDASLMERVTPSRLADATAFALVYLGHLSVQHDREALARTLGALGARGAPVKLHLVGHRSAELDAIFARHRVSDAVVRHDFVDTAAAYALMRGADALLMMPATHYAPSGASVGVKELELMASGSPVLCLGRPLPEIAPIAAALPQVKVVTLAEEAADVLEAWCHRGAMRGGVNAAVVAEYDWAACALTLERVLLGVARPSADRRDARTFGVHREPRAR